MADMNVVKIAYSTAKAMGVSDKVMLSLFEACIVESGFRNLAYGDADSIGVLQQRDHYGTKSQRLNVAWAVRQYLIRAIPVENNYPTAGKLAAAVQRPLAKYEYKYDAAESQAKSLLKQVSGKDYNVTTLENSSSDGLFGVSGAIESGINSVLTGLGTAGLYVGIAVLMIIASYIVYGSKKVIT
jgi:hypothetical protein